MTEAKYPNGKPMVQKTLVTQKGANERVLVLMVPSGKKSDFTKFMQINFVKRNEHPSSSVPGPGILQPHKQSGV